MGAGESARRACGRVVVKGVKEISGDVIGDDSYSAGALSEWLGMTTWYGIRAAISAIVVTITPWH